MSRVHSIYPVPIANIGTGVIGGNTGAINKPIAPTTTFQSSLTGWIDQVIISVFND
jgi:hypothetical protein